MKIKQSKTVKVKRSSINFAAYNPRKKSKKVVNEIKKNFKKIGYLGGIVVNKTGVLISGHKRIEAMDLIYKYNGENDYEVKIELADLDEQTEKEQNIFMNNKSVQGEFDFKLLAKIANDINFDNAGLTDFDIEKMAVFAPSSEIFIISEPEKLKKELTEEQQIENIEKLKAAKEKGKQNGFEAHDNASNSHFILVFDNYDNKIAFMEGLELDSEQKMMRGEDFAELINIFE